MSEPLFLVANLLCRTPTAINSIAAIAPQTCVQRASNPTGTNLWATATPQYLSSPRFRSGAQLYTFRINALLRGQIQTALKEGASTRLWTNGALQPTYQQWQQLLSQEVNLAAKYQGRQSLSVLLGDSLSLWFPNDLLPASKIWLNQGISGENTSQILARLGTLNGLQPDTIYLMAGVNDLKQGVSEMTLLNNLRAIIHQLRCQHPETVIIVQSLLPTNHHYLRKDRAIRINQQLQAIATQEGVNYLNLYPLFTDANGGLRLELTTDGLHLSDAGYVQWQGALQRLEDCLTQ
ncbi:GDSL-type esterase/lipase family protein [Picosynechococcus sp. PCC 7003]|uniref:GDSL-type esterase/lipase family protein n=1 Tax=Picosynechococcus sp. PCC 7003 TaxID=374981 RepID=UPI000A4779CA|nr:GDSL-type esterase/lipase family protein [Picosynechococcus sp. PCC 7003]